MQKTFICSLLSFLLAFSAAFSYPVFAQNNTDEFYAKLKELDQKRKQITETYKAELRKINMEISDKISVIKKKFHDTRKEYLQEKADKTAQLRLAYDEKIAALNEQESMLMETRPPAETSNFAKRRRKSRER